VKATTTRCSLVSNSSKKPTHERSPDRRSDANLSRGMYRAIDRRKQGNEPVLPRLLRSKFGSNLVDDKAYLDRHFERMHET
jgi:hypothetical protein